MIWILLIAVAVVVKMITGSFWAGMGALVLGAVLSHPWRTRHRWAGGRYTGRAATAEEIRTIAEAQKRELEREKAENDRQVSRE